MQPFAEEIISSCHNALKSNQLKQGECIRLMYPIGKMLSQMPPDQVLPRSVGYIQGDKIGRIFAYWAIIFFGWSL
jgi:hypothetical protein